MSMLLKFASSYNKKLIINKWEIRMFRILTIVTFISLQSIGYASDSNYNPDLFRMNKETQLQRIGLGLSTTKANIIESLSFLSPSPEETILPQKYGKENFEALITENMNLQTQYKVFQEFVENCSEIYYAKNQTTTTQEAVYRFLRAVGQDLSDHYTNLPIRQKLLLSADQASSLPAAAPDITLKNFDISKEKLGTSRNIGTAGQPEKITIQPAQ